MYWLDERRSTASKMSKRTARVLQVIDKASGGSASFTAHPDDQYVRVDITDSDGRRAWTQPVFLDGRCKLSPYRKD
jgi:hypothetical protein